MPRRPTWAEQNGRDDWPNDAEAAAIEQARAEKREREHRGILAAIGLVFAMALSLIGLGQK